MAHMRRRANRSLLGFEKPEQASWTGDIGRLKPAGKAPQACASRVM
jgi:hypothetical protein